MEQKEIDEIEKIQKNFTKNIEGMETLNYQRLKKLNLYSMERRERFLIMNGWQQLEGLRENVLKLKTSERSIHENLLPIGGFQTFLTFEMVFVFLSRALK